MSERLARELAEPAAQLDELANRFIGDLVEADAMMLELLRILEDDPEQLEQARGFLDAMDELTKSAADGLGSALTFADTLHETRNLSRALRKPLSTMERAVRGIADAQAVVAEWKRRADEVRGAS